jgi:hypothetical protein
MVDLNTINRARRRNGRWLGRSGRAASVATLCGRGRQGRSGSRSSMAGLGCSRARWARLGAREHRAAGPGRRGKACRRAVGRLREVLGADASARRTPVRLGGSARGAGGLGRAQGAAAPGFLARDR